MALLPRTRPQDNLPCLAKFSTLWVWRGPVPILEPLPKPGGHPESSTGWVASIPTCLLRHSGYQSLIPGNLTLTLYGPALVSSESHPNIQQPLQCYWNRALDPAVKGRSMAKVGYQPWPQGLAFPHCLNFSDLFPPTVGHDQADFCPSVSKASRSASPLLFGPLPSDLFCPVARGFWLM